MPAVGGLCVLLFRERDRSRSKAGKVFVWVARWEKTGKRERRNKINVNDA